MRVLACDFDGVISDSAEECFTVALRTFLELRPGSRRGAAAGLLAPAAAAGASPGRRAFRELLPLGNRAEDFGVALASLDAGLELPDQASYDAYCATFPREWKDAFHRRFYEVRAALVAADERAWLELQLPYPGVRELLRRLAGRVVLAVATAKDRRSVERLLAHYGIAGLFCEDLVLDKETGHSKSAHLELLASRTGAPPQEITFLDDKVSHLEAVAGLGVRCVLAAWGYNSERERAIARERGFAVCGLDELEGCLLGAATEGARGA